MKKLICLFSFFVMALMVTSLPELGSTNEFIAKVKLGTTDSLSSSYLTAREVKMVKHYTNSSREGKVKLQACIDSDVNSDMLKTCIGNDVAIISLTDFILEPEFSSFPYSRFNYRNRHEKLIDLKRTLKPKQRSWKQLPLS